VSPLFVVQMPRGFRIRFYPSSISAALWADPGSRREDEDFVWAVLRPGDSYVDAGANIGQLVLAASRRVGPTGHVLGVEAHPAVYRYLEGNLALNDVDNALAVHCALGAEVGEVTFTSRRSDDQNYVSTDGVVRVPMRPLDEVREAGPVRLLKLDVEGYELPVLEGASRTLAATAIVYCELSASNCARFDYEPVRVEELLLGHGFVFIRWIDGAPSVSSTPYFASLPENELPATGYNLIAVRPDVADEVVGHLQDAGWTPS
jgi:FkbM family methyltransferase